MNAEEYFASLRSEFERTALVASSARAKGIDPSNEIESLPAQDLPSRVEGIVGIEGVADIVRKHFDKDSRTKMVFGVVKEICTHEAFATYVPEKRVEIALRVGLSILTEGVLVAPTEGIQGVKRFRNQDNSDYIAVFYAGPIRGAGGTAAALSVAIVDYARQFFGIGEYKATYDDIERYIEEIELYHNRVARLQYKPTDNDIRVMLKNCAICIDGVPTGSTEVNSHRDMKKIGIDGKDVKVPNKIRSGMPLVLCEGIAQKAKKLIKEVRIAGLDWNWLNEIITINKSDKKADADAEDAESFLDELVAGRPILAYPKRSGGFRLRYGRSRFTGIASKGIHPATMVILDGFIAVGTQLRIEFPGKGCVVAPVDSIEGPFVKLRSGDALRVTSADQAAKINGDVVEILSLGDLLVTYGDFKKSNTIMYPSSYVSEIWEADIKRRGGVPDYEPIRFCEAYAASRKHGVPLHPTYLYEFAAIRIDDLRGLLSVLSSSIAPYIKTSLFSISELEITVDAAEKRTLELLNVPHKNGFEGVKIDGEYAQSIIASLGLCSGDNAEIIGPDQILELNSQYAAFFGDDIVSFLNTVSPIKIVRRSTFIGARIGRPEKAKERLTKPASNALFPIGNAGGKERNLVKAYTHESRKFGNRSIKVEMALYYCRECKRMVHSPYCYDCEKSTSLVRMCRSCKIISRSQVCSKCGLDTIAYDEIDLDLSKIVENAAKRVGVGKLPAVIKGVHNMNNSERVIEPIEKGILRSIHGVYVFKDGTARFDATDMPITHFYPSEIGASVDALRNLGYTHDYEGAELKHDNQLVEMRHQDVILNRHGADYFLKVANFIDDELDRVYKIGRFYNVKTEKDLIGHLVVTLSPHTSCGVVCRIIGFSDARVGFAHPYTISARRRNCDGDEDTSMMLLDALVNFSRHYLPSSVGGTMDAPIILTVNVNPEEVDDEVHAMEVVDKYGYEFYEKTFEHSPPGDVKIELVSDRLDSGNALSGILFTHNSSADAVRMSPKISTYAELKTMREKVDAEFSLMDKIMAVDKSDAAKKLIINHFIPDLIGNLHSFSKQEFRCAACNAKYRRVPLSGKCTRDGGKLLLTISKGGIEKYRDMAIGLAEKYNVDEYIKQRLNLIKADIENTFGATQVADQKQFDLSRFM
jgi:DNA polymerase II large subunit